MPLTIDKTFDNTQRWFMTLLVAAQALRNEFLSEIIVSHNKDDTGDSLDPVLKATIVTLNGDMVNFRKLFAGSTPVDKLTPASPVCAACDRFKKQYEEARSENTTKARSIVSLKDKLPGSRPASVNGGGYRTNPNRDGSNRGGFSRGSGSDHDRDRDRDRDRDQDRDRDDKSRKRAEPSSNDTKNP